MLYIARRSGVAMKVFKRKLWRRRRRIGKVTPGDHSFPSHNHQRIRYKILKKYTEMCRRLLLCCYTDINMEACIYVTEVKSFAGEVAT